MAVLTAAGAALAIPATPIVGAAALAAPHGTGGAPVRAHAARTLHANENANLHLVHSDGSRIVEQGPVSGSLPGTVKGSFNVGPTITGSVTLYVRGAGTISGRGSGTLHNAYGHLYESFGGSLTITGGSGRYEHAHGRAGFYGSINRRTDAMQVQTSGTIYY